MVLLHCKGFFLFLPILFAISPAVNTGISSISCVAVNLSASDMQAAANNPNRHIPDMIFLTFL